MQWAGGIGGLLFILRKKKTHVFEACRKKFCYAFCVELSRWCENVRFECFDRSVFSIEFRIFGRGKVEWLLVMHSVFCVSLSIDFSHGTTYFHFERFTSFVLNYHELAMVLTRKHMLFIIWYYASVSALLFMSLTSENEFSLKIKIIFHFRWNIIPIDWYIMQLDNFYYYFEKQNF